MKEVTGMDFGVRFYRRRPQKKNVQKKQDLVEGIAMRLFKKSELKMIFTNRVIDYAQAKVAAKIDFAKLIAKKEVRTAPRIATKEKALWVAAQAGDSRAIRLLVMAGVDIDARDSQGSYSTEYRDAVQSIKCNKDLACCARNDADVEIGRASKLCFL